MKSADYSHLHVHTTRSLLDGYTKVPDLVDVVKAHGQVSVALTDHGTMGNIPLLWKESKRVGIKPIAGIETYICEDMAIRGGGKGVKSPYYHLTLLAQSLEGYKNLCRLSTLSYTDGFYSKPRIDLKALEQHAGGLIVLSGCIGGWPQQLIIKDNEAEALEWCANVRDIMDGRFFLESQSTGENEQDIVNATFLSWTTKHKFKHVLTGDSHYTKPSDHIDHDVLLCIGMRKMVSEEARMRFVPEQYHVKTTQEMEALFFPESSLKNTRMISDMCESYELPRAGGFPKREHAYAILESTAMEGLITRMSAPVETIVDAFGYKPQTVGTTVVENEEVYWDRLMQELEVIRTMGFEDYFLIAHDIVSFAREHAMWWSWGRGSSVGSLVAYALGITGMDPVKYHLYFERFLNSSRKNPPDIDIDFTDEDRPEVIKFIEQKYGANCVSHIATFGTLGPRQVVMDLCTVFNKPKHTMAAAIAMLPYDQQSKISDILEDERILRGLTDYLGKDLVQYMHKFDGIPRHGSVHAAGVIIDREPLTDKLPMLMPRSRPVKASQYVYEDLVSLGFEKFDILGVRTLRTIKEVAIMTKTDLSRIPMDDEKTFKLLSSARTVGVFQFESWGCRKFLNDFKPMNFEDVMMANALYRPGPMQGADGLGEIIARRTKRKAITYPHPSVESILKNTFGIMVYQEQVMAVVRVLAGWSLAEADLLRYAVGKKKPELVKELGGKFVTDCVKMGHSQKFADEMFTLIKFFGRYGWNKAHAAAYGMVSYVCAYFKANYPAEFMCCILNSEESDPKHRQELIGDCARMGIRVLKPHVNESSGIFEVRRDEYGGCILPGLISVRGIGTNGMEAILDARKLLGRFSSIENFRERVPAKLVNILAIKNLKLVGAFKDVPELEAQIDVPF